MTDSVLSANAEEGDHQSQRCRRALILAVVCLGVSMIVLDTTIVTVALPAILSDLHIGSALMSWAMNAYMLTFGGFLLLSGRLGDLYGRRRLFVSGIALFTAASLGCGLSQTLAMLRGGSAS